MTVDELQVLIKYLMYTELQIKGKYGTILCSESFHSSVLGGIDWYKTERLKYQIEKF